MKKMMLHEMHTEDLVGLIHELNLKLKRKHERLVAAESRLGRAKDSVSRLQGIVAYQRERILELYKEQIPSTREVIDATTHD